VVAIKQQQAVAQTKWWQREAHRFKGQGQPAMTEKILWSR